MKTLTALLAIAALKAAAALQDSAHEKLAAQIIPGREELAWREIPWRPAFWEAVVEAQEQDKPILLWAMNGHPLACT